MNNLYKEPGLAWFGKSKMNVGLYIGLGLYIFIRQNHDREQINRK